MIDNADQSGHIDPRELVVDHSPPPLRDKVRRDQSPGAGEPAVALVTTHMTAREPTRRRTGTDRALADSRERDPAQASVRDDPRFDEAAVGKALDC